MLKRLLVLLLLSALALPLGAAPPAERPLAIRCGRLLDVRAGRMLANVTILVREGRVVAVGENLRLPADAEVIDLSRATVLPGLIDLHVHLTSNPRAFGYRGLGISIPRQTLYGAMAARRMLETGFTTVRNVGADGYSDVALRDAIEAGEIPGPTMIVSGPALGITGGHCDENLLPFEFHYTASGVADGPWAVRAKVREVIKYGADLIKFCATGGVLSRGDSPRAQQYTLEEMQAIVEEAHRLGRKVAAHAHGAEGMKAAVRAGVDSIEHGTLIDAETIALMRERGTALVPTLWALDSILEAGAARGIPEESLEKARALATERDRNLKAALAGGVRFGFGTDAGVFPHEQAVHEFVLLVRLGMTPLDALRSATLTAAEVLGMENDIGTIEAGKRADIIAVEGNPLEDIRAMEGVKFVMKGGRVVRNDF